MADTRNQVGEAFVALRYNIDRLGSDLARATGMVDRQVAGIEQTTRGRFARIASAIGAPFAALSRSLSGVQSQITSLGGALATALVARSVVNTNVEFERLAGSLETVTGSAQAGQAALAAMTKFARETPFSVQQSVEAFVRLRSLGIEPTEERLRSFGNTSAAFGRSLTQFIEAVADASTGEFERLKEFGIRARQQGEEVAFTFQGVSTVVGKNSAEIVAYLEQLGAVNFGDAMANQMNRLPGLVSNLSDVFSGLARAVGDGGLNDGLKELLRTLVEVGEETDGLASEIGALIGGALKGLADGIKALSGFFGGLTPEMRKATVQFAAIGSAIAVALPVLAVFVASISALLSPIGLVVAAIAGVTAGVIALRDQTITFGDTTIRVARLAAAVWTTVSQALAGTVAWADHLLLALGRLITLDFSGAGSSVSDAAAALRNAGDEMAEAWASAFEQAGIQIEDRLGRRSQDLADAAAEAAAAARRALEDIDGGDGGLPPAATNIRTIGDAIRDVRFDTMVAGLSAAESEARSTARALGLIEDVAGDLDAADPGSLFRTLPGAAGDVEVLTRALQGLNAARDAAAKAAAKELELDQRATAVKEDILTAEQRRAQGLAELDVLLKSNRLSTEQYALAVAKLNKEYQLADTAADHMAKLRQTVAQLGAQMQGVGAATRDFLIGFAQGVGDYALTAGNAYEQAAQLGRKAMQGLEDALVEFATTGKIEVKEMVASILADLSRLAIQQGLSSAIGQLLPIATAALGNYFGGGATGTTGTTGATSATAGGSYKPFGFALGGTFKVGGGGGIDSQLVAFRATPGEIVDVHRGESSIRARSSGISVSQSFNIDARGAELGVEERLRAVADQIVERTKAAVRDEATRSGRYGSAFG